MSALATSITKHIAALATVKEGSVSDPVGSCFGGRQAYALSSTEDQAIEILRAKCAKIFNDYSVPQSSYNIECDAFGNLFVTYFGANRSTTVASGSHVDSVRNGGLFDGLSGVASSLSFLERLVKSGQAPDCNFMLIAFRAEESSPTTGRACLGSAIASGTITAEELQRLQYKRTDGSEVPLSQYFSATYGANQWEQVLAELDNPPLRSKGIVCFEEVHPEQGPVLQRERGDVGIVVQGIGGAERIEVSIPQMRVRTTQVRSPLDPLCEVTLRIEGRPDHTGSTPHNRVDGKLPYRSDALVGSFEIVQALFRYQPLSMELSTEQKIGVVAVHPEVETGFTTVPHNQKITLVGTQAEISAFMGFFERSVESSLTKLGLKVMFGAPKSLNNKTAEILNPCQVLYALKAVRDIDWVASCMNIADEFRLSRPENRTGIRDGLVRATATDLHFDFKGLRCKIDLRNARSELGDALHRGVFRILDRMLSDVFGGAAADSFKVVSKTKPAVADVMFAEHKGEISKFMGLSALTLPSLPGHDATSLAKIGIPVSMTFLKDNGRSHNPFEEVSREALTHGITLSHSFLASKLGVVLDAFED